MIVKSSLTTLSRLKLVNAHGTITQAAFNGSKDLFGHAGQAELYAKYRPRYNHQELLKGIMSRVKCKQLYVDVACGSGQLTTLVAPYFKKTIGIDKSYEQINQVSKNGIEGRSSSTTTSASNDSNNIDYIVGSTFEMPIEDSSVDLLTVAQAFHWLVPHSAFFKEAIRVLNPNGGVCTITGYTFPTLKHPPQLQPMFSQYYNTVLGANKSPGEPGCYWDCDRRSLDNLYRDVAFPYSHTVERHEYPHTVTMSLSHFIAYQESVSAYRTLLNSITQPVSPEQDPLYVLNQQLLKAMSTENNDILIEVQWNYFTVSFMKDDEVISK